MRVSKRFGLLVYLSGTLLASDIQGAPVRDVGRTWDGPLSLDNRYQYGFIDWGSYVINKGGAASARPDGSGSALFQYRGYLEDAINGDQLKCLADMSFLTDRQSPPTFKPRSFDYLLGVSTRGENLKLQFDREEFIPLDRSGLNYRYWDVRGSYIFNLASGDTAGIKNLNRKPTSYGLSGVLSAGYFLHNADMPARIDNSGLAFMRYRAGVNAQLMDGLILFRGDADFLTDRNDRRYAPADLDLALGIGTSYQGSEIMIYRKTRQALDRGGYAGYYFISFRQYFDSRGK